MKPEEVSALIERELADFGDFCNRHTVELPRALRVPEPILVIDRALGRVAPDVVTRAWLVLVEDPDAQDSYRIVFDEASGFYGLAVWGFPVDGHLVVISWHDTFLDAFLGM